MESKSIVFGIVVGLLLGVGVAYGIPLKSVEKSEDVAYDARIDALEGQVSSLKAQYNQLNSYIAELADHSIPLAVDIDEFQSEILYYLSLGYGYSVFDYHPYNGTYGGGLDGYIYYPEQFPNFNITVIEVSKRELRMETPTTFSDLMRSQPQLFFNIAEKRIYLLKGDFEQEPQLLVIMWWSPK